MLQLGLAFCAQQSWKQIVFVALSPEGLRLETLIARYIGVADAPMLAALQGLETCLFMDVMRGRIVSDGNLIEEIFWRSLIQSMVVLDNQLKLALADHEDIGCSLGPASYIGTALDFIERGVPLEPSLPN